jgi:hypothetical protein
MKVEGSRTAPILFRRKIAFMSLFPLGIDALNFHLFSSAWKQKHHLRFVTFDLAFSHFHDQGQYTRLSAYAVSLFLHAFVCLLF